MTDAGAGSRAGTGTGTEAAAERGRARLELSPRAYRHLDRTSKLFGVALVALGLDAGGDTLGGLALGAVGVAVALTTVFVRRQRRE